MIRSISTYQQTLTMSGLIGGQKKSVDKAATELATGLRQDVFSAEGGTPGTSLALRSRMSSNDAWVIANKTLSGKLDVMNVAMNDLREAGQEVMDFLLAGDASPVSAEALKVSARGALETLVNRLNTTHNGEHLFSGTATDTPAVSLDADNNLVYNGNGDALSTRIDDGNTLSYGARGNEQALLDLAAALATVLQTDFDAMSQSDYAAFRTGMTSDLGVAIDGVLAIEARMGGDAARLDRLVGRQESVTKIYNDQILAIEGVDPEEAAVRLEALRIQLNSTYEVTARLSEMSFLNFMR